MISSAKKGFRPVALTLGGIVVAGLVAIIGDSACTIGQSRCDGTVEIFALVGCVVDVQLSYTPIAETIGPPACKPPNGQGLTFISPPNDCPPYADGTPPSCSRSVTLRCDTGEVTTVDVTWQNGCGPSPSELLVCSPRLDAGFDAGADGNNADGADAAADVSAN